MRSCSRRQSVSIHGYSAGEMRTERTSFPASMAERAVFVARKASRSDAEREFTARKIRLFQRMTLPPGSRKERLDGGACSCAAVIRGLRSVHFTCGVPRCDPGICGSKKRRPERLRTRPDK